MENEFTEMQKLGAGLVEKGIVFKCHPQYTNKKIVCGSWEATCPYESDLIKVEGFDPETLEELEGEKTADEILARL